MDRDAGAGSSLNADQLSRSVPAKLVLPVWLATHVYAGTWQKKFEVVLVFPHVGRLRNAFLNNGFQDALFGQKS